ncbi:MAG: hydrogenase 3 maturation endopeptidase HyCI [Candidatus Aminicenantales bacterium]
MKTHPPADWKRDVAAALTGAERIAVCGIGHDLRGDDAAGVLCLRKIKSESRRKKSRRDFKAHPVDLIECGETPESQTGRIRIFQPDLVLLIDAARDDRAPGEIFIIDPRRIADDDVSTHRISLGMLVRFIRESIGARVLMIGIEPASTEIGATLSEAVKSSVFMLSEYLNTHLQPFFRR